MQMRQFTPRKPPPDIGFTPQEGKPDPEVGLRHDESYARAWDCEYEKPVFDAEKKQCNATQFTQNSNTTWFINKRSLEHTRDPTGVFP